MTSVEEVEQSSEISIIDNSSCTSSTPESSINAELLDTCIEVKNDSINIGETSTSV